LGNFVGAISVRMYAAVNANLKDFHTRLAATYDLFLAYLLLSRIEGDASRSRALIALALSVRGARPADAAAPPPAADSSHCPCQR
jgi:hypothetical protein